MKKKKKYSGKHLSSLQKVLLSAHLLPGSVLCISVALRSVTAPTFGLFLPLGALIWDIFKCYMCSSNKEYYALIVWTQLVRSYNIKQSKQATLPVLSVVLYCQKYQPSVGTTSILDGSAQFTSCQISASAGSSSVPYI